MGGSKHPGGERTSAGNHRKTREIDFQKLRRQQPNFPMTSASPNETFGRLKPRTRWQIGLSRVPLTDDEPHPARIWAAQTQHAAFPLTSGTLQTPAL